MQAARELSRQPFQNRRIEAFAAVPTLVIPHGRDLPRDRQLRLGDWVLHATHRKPTVPTEVWLYYDDTHLHAHYVCHEPRMDQVRTAWPEQLIHTDDVVELKLDVGNTHHRLLHFTVNAAGQKQVLRILRTRVSMAWERGWAAREEKVDIPFDATVERHADRWTATMRIPLSSLSPEPIRQGEMVGLSVLRHRTPWPIEVSTYPKTWQDVNDPTTFADAAFGFAPVALTELSFGEITLGFNKAQIAFRNLLDRQAEFTLYLRTRYDADYRLHQQIERTFALRAGESTSLELEFELNGIDWKHHRIELEIIEKESGAGYRGSFSYGYANSYLLGFRPHGAKPTPNPVPGDADFLNRKRSYILTTLPRFVRKNTAQGAPSDYYLEAEDGSVAFNLMQAGVLQKMADYLCELFDNDEDRLLGANYLLHQPDVLTYTKQLSSLTARMNPLSILRLGGGMCSEFAAALLGLVRKMRRASGEPFAAWQLNASCTTEGHCIVAVELKADASGTARRVILDPSVGRFYIKDNRLAAVDELNEDLSLIDMGCSNQRHIWSCPARQWYSDPGTINYPDWAPEE